MLLFVACLSAAPGGLEVHWSFRAVSHIPTTGLGIQQALNECSPSVSHGQHGRRSPSLVHAGQKPFSSHEAHPSTFQNMADPTCRESLVFGGGGIKGQDSGLLAGQPCGVLNGPGWG